MPTERAGDQGLRDYLRILRRRKKVMILTVAAVMAIALIPAFLQDPVYEGRAQVLLKTGNEESVFDRTGERVDASRVVDTELLVLRSAPVRAAVRRQLGNVPKVSGTSLGQVDAIEIRARAADPGRAAAITNAYATAYIDFRRTQAVDDLLAAATQIQTKISELQPQIESTADASQKAALIEQQSVFRQRLDQVQVDAALKTGGAQLITPAAVPSSPVAPKPLRTGVFALAVGLILGVGLALLREHLDDSVKTKDDLERVAPDQPVVGLIPSVTTWKSADGARVISRDDPTAPATEAYRTLRTSIQFLGITRPLRTLQVTSPNAREGKSTTLANLGVSLAQAGRRVILVCCDLRRPRIHEFFGLPNELGFTSVLLGHVPLWTAVQEVPGIDGLSVLASGAVPPNPSELLSSPRTAEVLMPLQAEGYLVLVDSPPVLPVTDALVLSQHVDATLVVCAAGKTSRKDVARASELLQQVDAPLVGTVLNGVRAGEGYGYSYAYYREDGPRKEGVREDPLPRPEPANQ
jgi:succinoglycan biosynthesis transport protein ExoP